MEGYKKFRLIRLDTMEVVGEMLGESLRDPARESLKFPGLPIQILEMGETGWTIKSVVVHPKPI